MLDEKYYKFVKNPPSDWKPFHSKPMYDEHPDLGSFEVEGSNPRASDYLSLDESGSINIYRPAAPDLFEGQKYKSMPPLEVLIQGGIIEEATKQQLQEDIDQTQALKQLEGEQYRSELNREFSIDEAKNAIETCIAHGETAVEGISINDWIARLIDLQAEQTKADLGLGALNDLSTQQPQAKAQNMTRMSEQMSAAKKAAEQLRQTSSPPDDKTQQNTQPKAKSDAR